MASTPYRAISWMPYELVSEDKMNQSANNVQWLFEHTPRAVYTHPGLKREQGVRMICGKVAFQKRNRDEAVERVHFHNFFSRRCNPVITTGINSSAQKKIFVVHEGLDQLHPDHRGFRVSVEIAAETKKKDKINKRFFVTWIAMGY